MSPGLSSPEVMIIEGETYMRPKPKNRPRVADLQLVVDLTGESVLLGDMDAGSVVDCEARAPDPSSAGAGSPVSGDILSQTLPARPLAELHVHSLLPGQIGDHLGPAHLIFRPERQDFEIRWAETETLVLNGRPLYSDRTTRLFLGDLQLSLRA